MDVQKRLRILVVDNHPVTARGLEEILKDEIEDLNFDYVAGAAEAMEKIWATQYDLVLLELSLSGRNGLEVLAETKKHSPSTYVLVVSIFAEDLYAVRALKAGASGYLRKDASASQVVAAVRQVLAGEKYISGSLAQSLARYFDRDTEKMAHERLSGREFEVLCLIGRGMSMKEIAFQLSLNIKTVSTYRTRILKSMALHSTADLIRYCIRTKLCDE